MHHIHLVFVEANMFLISFFFFALRDFNHFLYMILISCFPSFWGHDRQFIDI